MKKILVVGTSKSKHENVYYLESKDKFWGSLAESGFTRKRYEPHEHADFTVKHNVSFAELAFDEIVTNDKKLKEDTSILEKGIPKLIDSINKSKPEVIVFNGKSAAGWFFQYVDNGGLSGKPSKFLNEDFNEYGFLKNWNNASVFVLPNLSNANNNAWAKANGFDHWVNFWKKHSGNVQIPEKQTTSRAWLFAGLAVLAIIIIIYLISNQS